MAFVQIAKNSNETEKVKERESNFELLRLFSIFIIVFYHLLLAPNMALEYAFNAVLLIAVPCFVLISGYFGIRASVKGLINLLIKCVVYAVGLYLAYCIVVNKTISIKDFIKSFVGFYPGYWFIGTYIGLYLISPIINIPLKLASRNQKLIYLGIFGLISFWLGWAGGQHTMSDGKSIANLIFLYCIGDFLRYNIEHDKIKSKKYYLLCSYLILNIFLFIIFILTKDFKLFQVILYKLFFPYNSPGLILNAILCFLLFSTIKIKSSKINWLAVSTLSIYLIHAGLLREFLQKIVLYMNEKISNLLFSYFALALFSLIICICCIIIDKLLEPILKIIERVIYRRIGLYKIDNILKENGITGE